MFLCSWRLPSFPPGLVPSRASTVAMYKLNTIAKPLQNVHSHSRSAAAAAAVHAAARHQRPLRPLLMAETGLWGPCASPTHVRSTAASTVDADIMLSMTSAVARHCISPRCWCAPTAGLVQLIARRPHSVDGTECRHRESGCTRPAVGAYQHRSACSAHGTLTQAPRGVVPEPGTRATGRVLCSAGHGHRVLSIPVQDRPHGRSDRP